MSKYEASVYNVTTPQGVVMSALTDHYAESFAAELNRLLARAEQAERDRDEFAQQIVSFAESTVKACAERDEARRDRDLLGRCLQGPDRATVGEMDAALSRCTPPASKEP